MIEKIVRNHIGIASVTPEGKVCKGESYHMIRVSLVVSFHMALDITTAKDFSTF
jgi:hypothetical protein